MNVIEIMQQAVATCAPQDNLAGAAKLMRAHKCGFLPVVDSHGAVAGVMTDRDVCLVASETQRAMTHISVEETMSHPVFNCFPDEHVKAALATMSKHHVRRLPVVDKHGHLQGVLSIDDVVQASQRRGSTSAEDIVEALRGIGAPRHIEGVLT